MANGKPLSELYKDLPCEQVIPILLNEVDILREQNRANVQNAEERFAAGERRSVWLQRSLITFLLGLVGTLGTMLLTR